MLLSRLSTINVDKIPEKATDGYETHETLDKLGTGSALNRKKPVKRTYTHTSITQYELFLYRL